jgi:phospholipid/cholesterol/gamma-HCH transport system substrate-binding protein
MRARRIGLALVGGALGLMLVLTGVVLARNGLVGTWDYHVRVRVADADGLVEGSSVAIAGVPAGRVLDLGVADHAAVLTLGISDDARPLLSDTTTSIRPKGLAGERFVELTPGIHGSPVADGGMLSAPTAVPVEVEDVLDAFDPTTRASLRTLLTELGAGMAGNGDTANHDLGELLALVDRAQGLATDLQAQDDHIGPLLGNLDTVVSALASLQASDHTLDRLAANSATVTSALAARDTELRSLLSRLTTVLDELTGALGGHEGRFRDAIARLPALEAKLRGLLAATDPALATVEANLPSVQRDLIQLADGVWSPFLEGNRLVVTAAGSMQALSLPPGVPAPPGAATRAQVVQFLTGGR